MPHSSDSKSPPSQADRIFAELRGDLLRGRYRPGDRLPSERELAERFDTHRGTAREALKKLEQLGLVEIRPGGARAVPIEEASLDVVRHLIELDPIPDPDVFDQVFEVFGALFSLSARLTAERGSDDDLDRARAILRRLIDEELSLAEEFALVQALSELFAAASGNLVMQLVRRGLYTEVIGRLEHPEALLRRPPGLEAPEMLRALMHALSERDGAAASNAIFAITQAVRRNAVEVLTARRDEQAHREASDASPPSTATPPTPEAAQGALRR